MFQQEKQNRKNDHSPSLRHLDLDTMNAASSQDCTGLIPAAPTSEGEKEAYQQIFDYQAELGARPELGVEGKRLAHLPGRRVLHGNQARVSNKDGMFFTCQSDRMNLTQPAEYDFDSLPGSDEDLDNAREQWECGRE